MNKGYFKPMVTAFHGIWPFWIAMPVSLLAILLLPDLALLLPNTIVI